MTPKISVIIPVFNTERYIGRCLDSVQGQSLKDIEIICVDDGSTDGTLELLYKRAESDDRLRVVRFSDNRGPARTRNAGIELSAGDYVYFIDSDDWIDTDYLESMYSEIVKTGQDVVVNSEYIEEYESFELRNDRRDLGYRIPLGYCSPYTVQSLIPPLVILRLYKRSYILDNGVRFPDCRAGEDIYFSGLSEVLQDRSFVFRGPKYHYLQRKKSLAHQYASGFYYIENYKALYEEALLRDLSVDDMKLFQVGLRLSVSSEGQFLFLKDYCSRIIGQVSTHQTMYNGFDWFLVQLFTTCPDYQTLLSEYGMVPALGYIRKTHSLKINP